MKRLKKTLFRSPPLKNPDPWPLSWLGYALGCTFGFTWGFLLGTGKIEKTGNLWVFRGLPKWAFGRGGVCVGNCYLTDSNVTPAILRHEEIHRQQWRKYGLFTPALYWLSGADPLRNRFEIEAGLGDGGYQ